MTKATTDLTQIKSLEEWLKNRIAIMDNPEHEAVYISVDKKLRAAQNLVLAAEKQNRLVRELAASHGKLLACSDVDAALDEWRRACK